MSFVRKFIACLISIALVLAQLSAAARGTSIDVAGNGSVLSLGINGSKGSASKKWTSPSGIVTQGSLDVIVENATISGGQIEVTSQTNKQTARQLASLNRNADKSLEITSVIDEGFELYISDTSIKAVGKIARVFFREINELVTAGNISPEQADILRKITACGGQQGFNSWNPLSWIITPAYAEEDCSDITLKELTQQIDVQTLKQLIDVCKDPILKAEAQYLLTMVLKKDLSSNDIYALEHFNPWDIEGLKKLSPEALEVVKVLSDLLSCTSPYCILKRQSIESQWDSNLLQIITFAHMNVPKSTPIGIFKTDGLTFSEYLTAVQTEELISIGVGLGIGKAFASAIVKLKIVPTLAAKLRSLLKGGADKAFTKADFPEIKTAVSQKQNRHIEGRPEYGGGGTLSSKADAQEVLSAYHGNKVEILGKNDKGFPVVRYNRVTGKNNSAGGGGYTNQPTNIFIIKGTSSPSVVPTNPNWVPK